MKKREIPVETEATERCRTALAPYQNYQVLAVGYLAQVSQNKGLKAHLAHRHNALLMDVHVIKDISDDKEMHINLDHVHCQIGNLKFKPYLGKYVIVSAEIQKYQSKYNGKPEARYGFFKVDLADQSKAILKQLNFKYQSHLSHGQVSMLKRAKTMVETLDITVASLTELQRRLVLSNMNDRTQLLSNVISKLYNGHGLSAKQLRKFMDKYTVTDDKEKLAIAENTITKLQQHKDHLVNQNKQLLNLTRDQANLLKQHQPASLWQAIRLYFAQKHSLEASDNLVTQMKPKAKARVANQNATTNDTPVSDEQLAKLQSKFNK